jgi:hypothetical protein
MKSQTSPYVPAPAIHFLCGKFHLTDTTAHAFLQVAYTLKFIDSDIINIQFQLFCNTKCF